MKAIRYTPKKKAEVVKFVRDFDREHGRGGKSAAHRKFNINHVTISDWLKKADKKEPAINEALSDVCAGKTPRQVKQDSATVATLKRMLVVQEEIAALAAEFNELKATV